MREILFRGKSIEKDTQGQWVYGGIIHQTDFYGDKVDRYYIMDGTVTIDYDIGDRERVAPKTIGQFTGLFDKNGNKIFEDDIVKLMPPKEDFSLRNPREERILKVVFFDGVFAVDMRKWFKYGHGRLPLRDYETERLEIVGNIHDNPELLEGT